MASSADAASRCSQLSSTSSRPLRAEHPDQALRQVGTGSFLDPGRPGHRRPDQVRVGHPAQIDQVHAVREAGRGHGGRPRSPAGSCPLPRHRPGSPAGSPPGARSPPCTSRSRPTREVNGSGKPGGHARPSRTGHPVPTARTPQHPVQGSPGSALAPGTAPRLPLGPLSRAGHQDPGSLPIMCSGPRAVNSFLRFPRAHPGRAGPAATPRVTPVARPGSSRRLTRVTRLPRLRSRPPRDTYAGYVFSSISAFTPGVRLPACYRRAVEGMSS